MSFLCTYINVTGQTQRTIRQERTHKQLKKALAKENCLLLTHRKINPRQLRITPKVITQFIQQLYTLLNAGRTLKQSLIILSKQTPATQKLSQSLLKKINQSTSLHDAFSKKHLTEKERQLLAAGNESGQLTLCLKKLLDQRLRLKEIKQKLIKALTYPACITIVSISVCIFLLTYIVPQFQTIFQNFGSSLPWPTQWVIFLSRHVLNPYLILGFIIFSVTLFIWRERINYSRLPVIKTFHKHYLRFHWCYLLSTLLSAGTPLMKALRLAENTLTKQCNVANKVQQGLSLSEATTLFLTLEDCSLLASGEESGQLNQTLSELASHYQNHIEEKIERLLTLIEPISMLGLAVLIGSLIIAMYLPIFNMGGVL